MSVMRSADGELGSGGAKPALPAWATAGTTSADSAATRATGKRRTGRHSMDVPAPSASYRESQIEGRRVALPSDVAAPFEVYVNGIPQRLGDDYRVEGDELVFSRSLAREGNLGFWRWLSIFLGFAGTYRKHDNVDVVYERAGRRVVATGLPLVDDERE